jgi:ribosomal protein S18 acetylase RimI-like enzyme
MYQFLAGWDLFGYRIGGDVVGCIGIQLLTWQEGVVRHISVAPEHRAQGIGRALIGYVLRRFALTRLSAETDAEAVGFYRRCGFAATALPEPYPGVERFQCVWEVESPALASS